MKFDLISQTDKEIQSMLTDILKEKYGKNLIDKETISKMRTDVKPSNNWETIYYYEDTAILKTSVENKCNKETNNFAFTIHIERL